MNVTVETNYLLRRYQKGERLYRLFCSDESSARFRIEICDHTECAGEDLCASFTEAVVLFEKIANSDTPPYVLSEILADFVAEKG